MQNAADIVKASLIAQPGRAEKQTSATERGDSIPTEVRVTAMRRLWERLVAIYGHKWASVYGEASEDAGGALTLAADTWRRGLAGIPEANIGKAIESCLTSADAWPPTLPQFRAMCFEVPTLASVRLVLNDRGAQYSPFVLLVWRAIDAHRYRQADANLADRLLREAYDMAREHILRGGALPDIPLAIAAPEPEVRVPASEETAQSHIDRVRAVLGGVDPFDPTATQGEE